jgi:hypothetical protein
MKSRIHSNRAFTAIELAVVLCILALLACLLLPILDRSRAMSSRISCVSHLKQIGTAYRIWAGDNGDRFPADVRNNSTNSGWHDFTLMTNAGPYCWSNYAIMQNELGQSPIILVCPGDVRKPAKDLNHLQNINLSYFFAPGANENFPLSILGGDRNLAPGKTPKNDFGFSPTNGRGNDVILQTNSPVCWSLNIHSKIGTAGEGNLLMADGSVQQTSSSSLRIDYIANAAVPSNFPSGFNNSQSNFFRLIFP